jgi:hypothetical protein
MPSEAAPHLGQGQSGTLSAREVTAKFNELDPVGLLDRMRLGVPRWKRLLADARDCAAGRADAAGRVAKLVDAVRSGAAAPSEVPAVFEQGLRNLALAETAPAANQSKFLKQATEQLVGASAGAGTGAGSDRFWGAVAASLLPLVYLRQCRISDALRMMEQKAGKVRICRKYRESLHLRYVEIEQDELGPQVPEELRRLRAARHADAEVATDADARTRGRNPRVREDLPTCV